MSVQVSLLAIHKAVPPSLPPPPPAPPLLLLPSSWATCRGEGSILHNDKGGKRKLPPPLLSRLLMMLLQLLVLPEDGGKKPRPTKARVVPCFATRQDERERRIDEKGRLRRGGREREEGGLGSYAPAQPPPSSSARPSCWFLLFVAVSLSSTPSPFLARVVWVDPARPPLPPSRSLRPS